MKEKLKIVRKKRTKVGLAKQHKETGELRQDLVTGKWVVVAAGRAMRPRDFTSERGKPRAGPKWQEGCPFCQLDKYPQAADVLRLPDEKDEWQVHIFPNKYPAFLPKDDFRSWNTGPYRAIESVGYHEILATRWHNKFDALLTQQELALQLEALVLRYRDLRRRPSVNYIQIIKNHGKASGASLEHPHHQILTVPVLPSDVYDMLRGAEKYAEKHGQEPYGVMLDFEIEERERIVQENEQFVAFCPYASRVPFEVWVMPREHSPYFENSGPAEREALAEVLRDVLARLYVGLHDPPYNYFVHSAPCDETGFVCGAKEFPNHRWHIEILPRLNVWGGFEMGTGLEITPALPEESAAWLREQKLVNTIN